MKHINEFLTKKDIDTKSWCLWDYKENGIREILVWKGNGRDQSDITEIDKNGTAIMNAPFSEIMKYCKEHKNDKVDKWHLDFFDANWDKIESIF